MEDSVNALQGSFSRWWHYIKIRTFFFSFGDFFSMRKKFFDGMRQEVNKRGGVWGMQFNFLLVRVHRRKLAG